MKIIEVSSGPVFEPLKKESSFWLLMLFTHLDVIFPDGVPNCLWEGLCLLFTESQNYVSPKGAFLGQVHFTLPATCHHGPRMVLEIGLLPGRRP